MLGGQAAPSPPAAPAPAAAAAVLLAPTVAPPVPVQLHVGDLGPATPPSAERGRRIRRNERDGRTKGTISFREAVLRQLKAAWPNDVEDAVLGRNAVAMGAVTDMADVARAADNVCRAFQRRLKLPVVRTTARHWKWDGGREGLPL